jgi:chromosome segregation ATPase
VTNQEVEQIKRHVDEAMQGLRGEIAQVRGEMTEGFAQVRGEMTAGFAQVRGEISEFRRDAAEVADHLMQEIVETRKNAGAQAEELRSEIRAVAEGVALANERINDVDLRVDNLTGEVRRGFAGVRAEIHRLHETDDELRRRIEAQERRGA